MDAESIKRLEFDEVRARLSACCDTVYGKELALKLWPEVNRGKVLRMRDRAVEAKSFVEAAGGRRLLLGLDDIRPLLIRLDEGGLLETESLLLVARTLEAVRDVKKLDIDPGRWPWLRNRIETLWLDAGPALQIRRVVDDKGEIRDHASPRLAELRRRIRTLERDIPARLERMINDPAVAPLLQEKLITLRNDRYVIPLRTEELCRLPAVVQDRSDTGATLFVEPLEALQSNNELLQARLEEKSEIYAILRGLALAVYERLEFIQHLLDDLGELDLALGIGRYAVERRCTAPGHSESGAVRLVRARHPLLEPATATPADLELAPGVGAMALSGPNGGGKTVCLKLIGLLQIMFQSGMLIPADQGSELPVFGKIFALIGDEQSIARQLSSFTSRMAGIIRALGEAGPGVLVLIDEIGFGTDPGEGGALACAVVEELVRRGARTVVTSHHELLKIFAGRKKGWINARMEFDRATGRPTFQVTMGLPGSSFGIATAEKTGLPPEVAARAREILRGERHSMEDIIEELDRVRDELDGERRVIEQEKDELAGERRKLDQTAAEDRDRRQNLLLDAYLKAQRIVDETRLQAMDILHRAHQAARLPEIAEAKGAVKQLKRKVDEGVESLKPRPVGPDPELGRLRPGDLVSLKGVSRPAELAEPLDGSGGVTVTLGGMRIRVPVEEVLPLRDPEPRPRASVRLKRSGDPPPVSTEFDIHGLYVEQAMEKLERYVNEAYLAGLNELRIVHGIGTGRLRNATHEFLRNHVLVREFRIGEPAEGGAGATVVVLYRSD